MKTGEEPRMVSIDEMLKYVGEYGRYQKIVNFILCLMTMPPLYHIMIMSFAADEPPWKCNLRPNTTCPWNGTFAPSDERRCRSSVLPTDWTYTRPKDYSVVTYFQIKCSERWQLELITSIFFLGWLLGSFALGWFCDKYGRKIILIVSTNVVIITGFLTIFMPSVYLIVLCRFIIGFFLPGTMIQSFIIISELVGAKYRAFAGLMIFVFGISAITLVGVKAYFIPNWKQLHIFCTLPYLAGVLLYVFIPESIRFLRVKGDMQGLMASFRKIAHWNRTEIPAGVEVSPPPAEMSTYKPSPRHLFHTRELFVKTCIQMTAYFVSGLVYYGVFLAAKDMGGNMYVDFMIISASEIPIIFLSMDFCERFGRKFTTSAPMIIVGAACIGIGYTPKVGLYKIVRVTLGMLGKCLVGSNMNTICTWSSELYTTQMRGEAMGFFQAFIRLGAAVAPWLDKEMVKLYKPSSFLFMGALSFLSFSLLSFLPETQGTVTADAEGEEEADGKQVENGGLELQKSGDVEKAELGDGVYKNTDIDHKDSYGNNAIEATD